MKFSLWVASSFADVETDVLKTISEKKKNALTFADVNIRLYFKKHLHFNKIRIKYWREQETKWKQNLWTVILILSFCSLQRKRQKNCKAFQIFPLVILIRLNKLSKKMRAPVEISWIQTAEFFIRLNVSHTDQ